MQCFQLYLKDSARAWLRSLPRRKIRSWDDLVDTFMKNFSATFKRPVGIEQLRSCKQQSKESMRSYLSRFTKLLNTASGVSTDRAIDAFSEGIRRERHIEELGRLKPKSMDVLMEIANGWADGEDQILRLRPRSNDEHDETHPRDSGKRCDRGDDRCKKCRDDRHNVNQVAASYPDRRDERRDDRRDDRRDSRRDDRRGGPSNARGAWAPKVADLPPSEQLNAPCYMHTYFDPQDNTKKSSPGGHTHLLVAVDKFTKWIEAIPVTNQAATTAVNFFK